MPAGGVSAAEPKREGEVGRESEELFQQVSNAWCHRASAPSTTWHRETRLGRDTLMLCLLARHAASYSDPYKRYLRSDSVSLSTLFAGLQLSYTAAVASHIVYQFVI